MNDKPKMMIITLHAGETSFDDCKRSITEQDYPHITHHVIENLPNVAAHEALYKTIMDESDDYDLFLKLDADMVLNRPTAISEIIYFWHKQNKPDHITFAVHDFMPDCLSLGVHLFSSQCRWRDHIDDPLFADPNPVIANRRLIVWNDIPPCVDHGKNMDDFSAFHFGVHRALKSFQRGRVKAKPQGYQAFRILMRTAKHYKKTNDTRLKYALIGAEFVRTKRISMDSGNKNNDTVLLLSSVIPNMAEDQQKLLIAFWMVPTFAWIYWWVTTGWRVLIGKVFA